MVTGQLEDSLRHEIESYIEGRLSSIKQEIGELQSQHNESLTRLLERQTEVQMDGSLAASILEHLRAAHEEGVDLAAAESSRARASSDMAIVKAAIEELDVQRSQADILKTLVNRAAAFAPRVAFFVIKGEQANGWRARGFEGTVGDQSITEISLPMTSDTVISGSAHSQTTWSGGPGSHAEDHLLLNRMGDEPPQRIISIPLIVRGRSVAVLYADSAGLDSEAIKLEALETLVRVAGMAVELLSISRVAAKPQAEEHLPEPAPTAEAPAYTPTREYEPQAAYSSSTAFSAPSPEVDQPAAYTPAREEQTPPVEPVKAAEAGANSGSFASDMHRDEVPQSIDQPQAPAPPMEYSEPSNVAPAPTPLGARRRYGSMDAELPISVTGDEERRLHNDARRFARLLVSEIKLYNEQKVSEGRSQSDLYDRLKEYIDRSREMYDKRVKPEVAARYDYFHHELVNTLAEGDSAKLGISYPGATVTA